MNLSTFESALVVVICVVVFGVAARFAHGGFLTWPGIIMGAAFFVGFTALFGGFRGES